MTTARELRRRIASCKLEHPMFQVHHEWLRDRIDDALDSTTPRIEWVVGPSRAGKSMLMEALAQAYPEYRINSGTPQGSVRRVPVLYLSLTESIIASSIPSLLLEALNLPVPRDVKASDLPKYAANKLKELGVKVLLLDEASHLVEPAARFLPRSAGDTLKVLSDRAQLSIFMAGIPRLELLIASNDQLRQRASAKREFLPYNFREADQKAAFAACVKTYCDMFAEHGWPIDIEVVPFVKNCFLHTGGLIGVLSKFMDQLCIHPRAEKPRALTLEDCKKASLLAGGTRSPFVKPFESVEVSDADLNVAHQYILDIEPLPDVKRK